jgi:hypothetical protein
MNKKYFVVVVAAVVVVGGTWWCSWLALHYKPEGRGFDSQWCHWNLSLT